MLDWLKLNAEWVFSGCGVAVVVAFFTYFNRPRTQSSSEEQAIKITNINYAVGSDARQKASVPASVDHHLERKSRTRILFIDDDTRFKVVGIIKSQGWAYTKIVRDVKAIESPEVQEADILFVDIQGVGKALHFSNEGLGLALAIKNKYPKKKVVIYSAQTSGERFDEALRRADDFLAKNADPYEFITVVERLAGEL